MRIHSFTAIGAALACLLALPRIAGATTKEVDLPCVGSLSAGADDAAQSESDTSPVLNLFGYNFPSDSDSEIICQMIVPTDYYADSSTEPSITSIGYSRDCVLCCCGNCGTTRKVRLEVSSKVLRSGNGLDVSWGTEDSDELSYTSTTCGGLCATNCYPDDIATTVTADATDDASSWVAGDLVLVRILRDTGVANNLASAFLLTSVRLTYPLD